MIRRSRKASHHHETLTFPKGFLWGTATSSHQVEGNNQNNDWWAWEQRGRVKGDQKSGLACDHYERYEQDFDYAKQMNNNAHRLSLEWSRIQPTADAFDFSQIEHYRQVLQALRDRGMKTFVTVQHFTNPLWFAKRGGWLASDSADRFAMYVAFVATHLADLVDFWVTLNEPMILASKGYLEGTWPPGKKSAWAMHRALKNLQSAHRWAYQLIHKKNPHARVGFAQNMFSYQLYRPHNFWDRQFMHWLDHFWNYSFFTHTKRHHDFIGLNYYFHYRLKKFRFNFKQFFVDPRQEQRDVSDIGWEVYAPGIAAVLTDLTRYKLPIYISENGIATENDDRRVRYLISYLKEIHAAITAGVDVRGYFYWSLLDNFEWEKGFGPRFGLVEVDFASQARRLKPSGKIYGQIAKSNSIEHRLLKYLGHGIKVPR